MPGVRSKASNFEIMGFKIPVKNWLKLQREHYREATSQHYNRLSEALDQDTQARIKQNSDRSITLLIDPSGPSRIAGIELDRSAVQTRLGERVSLICLGKRARALGGNVVRVGKEQVRVKLDEPLKVSDWVEQGEVKLKFRLKFDKSHELERRKRIERALAKFRKVSCSLSLHKSLLGDYSDRSNVCYAKARLIPMKGLKELKGNQLLAVDRSMRNRISLVEGPAGSGKTEIAAHIACSACRLRLDKIIVCSPVQSTVDKIAEMVSSTGSFLVIKLTSDGGKESGDRANSCSLEETTKRALYERARRRYTLALGKENQNIDRLVIHRQASRMANNCSSWLRQKIEQKLLRKANVVCCTTLQAGSPVLRNINFDLLIIDDAQAASELECMVPMMVRGIKQVTLLSDMRRDILMSSASMFANNRNETKMDGLVSTRKAKIKPVSKTSNHLVSVRNRQKKKCCRARKLDENLASQPGSLFERWISIGLSSVALKYQFRMHKSLAVFPNHHFNLSRLKTDANWLANQVRTNFTWLPRQDCLTALFDVTSTDKQRDAREFQYGIVKSLTEKLFLDESIESSRILVLTNVSTRCDELSRWLPAGIRCDIVGNLIGQERDYVLLTAFEDRRESFSSPDDSDYLRNEKALNLALTRARLGLFVVADCEYLVGLIDEATLSDRERKANESIHNVKRCYWAWQSLLNYYKSKNLTADLSRLNKLVQVEDIASE